jgi:hypothetical protein
VTRSVPVQGIVEADVRSARALVAGTVATLLLAAAVATGAGTAPKVPHTAVHRDFLRALAPCGSDAACTTTALRRATAPLASRIESLPRGRSGLAAWIRLAASLDGARINVPAVESTSLPDAILGFWSEAGYTPAAGDVHAVHAQAARLDPAYAASIAKVVNALRVSNKLAERATRGSGIETLKADPVRAMRLIGLAAARPGSVPEALRLEAIRVQEIIERIDMNAMASAAAVLADALAGFNRPAAAPADDVDVPFIFVGGEGDTVHAADDGDPSTPGGDRALLIDMSGNDTYLNNAGGGLVTIAGGSLAVDLGAGNDTYDKATGAGAQGFATGAAGLLYDDGGSDSFALYQFGQGSAVAGVGALYNAGDGNDIYESGGVDPIGTKAAALGGIGLLVDEGGDDSMHQDELDGFDWAGGGVALLANLGDGDDTYRSAVGEIPGVCIPILEETCPSSGTFAGPIQVSAEANGVAILYEEGGDDRYTCGSAVRQGCQGSAAGGSFGLLWDRGGNDVYWMGDSFSEDLLDDTCADLCENPSPIDHPVFPMGQGAAYAFCAPCTPPALAILYDEDGADSYTAARWAQGYGTFGGLGILADTGDDADSYSMQPPLSGARGNAQVWVDGILGIGSDN